MKDVCIEWLRSSSSQHGGVNEEETDKKKSQLLVRSTMNDCNQPSFEP